MTQYALLYVRIRDYITLHYKTSGQGKKNCKVHYGASHTTMLQEMLHPTHLLVYIAN